MHEKPAFNIEDIVYLKTDSELLPRIVTAYEVSKGCILYKLTQATASSWHYDYEIVKSKDEVNHQIGFKHAN